MARALRIEYAGAWDWNETQGNREDDTDEKRLCRGESSTEIKKETGTATDFRRALKITTSGLADPHGESNSMRVLFRKKK
jgi:hypothetical protein